MCAGGGCPWRAHLVPSSPEVPENPLLHATLLLCWRRQFLPPLRLPLRVPLCVTLPLSKGKKSQSFLRAVTLTSRVPSELWLCSDGRGALPSGTAQVETSCGCCFSHFLSRSPSLCCCFPSWSSLSVTQVISLPALSSAVFPTMPRKMGSWVLISRRYYKQ